MHLGGWRCTSDQLLINLCSLVNWFYVFQFKRATLQRAQHAGAKVLRALSRCMGPEEDGGGLDLWRPLRRSPKDQRQDQTIRHPRQLSERGLQVSLPECVVNQRCRWYQNTYVTFSLVNFTRTEHSSVMSVLRIQVKVKLTNVHAIKILILHSGLVYD